MRTWTTLDTNERCGACGDHILRGKPICIIAIHGIKRPILRCETCVGPAPEDPRVVQLRERAEIERRKDELP